ncbi:MAG: DUF692 domain-containing protein [Pseudomonadota bacterium]|nr:DUF692 domain-containing protein [Pseudomonadota bacterium]
MNLSGAGLGLRRSILEEFLKLKPEEVSFVEIAPENWIGVGGEYRQQFLEITKDLPLICHGLSLSIGSPSDLNFKFLNQLKKFFKEHNVTVYSEHLSYCSDEGYLYDLMPIPFTEASVKYVANRIKKIQEILELRIIIENVSYYAAPSQEMSEIDFLKAVLSEADCDLLLDINNVFVNSINHSYNAEDFLNEIPKERLRYFHVAGHFTEAEDLLIDTHGENVCKDVWNLLGLAYQSFGPVPTVLERDFNLPPLKDLLNEINQIQTLQRKNFTQN